jgi:hypothetical protein
LDLKEKKRLTKLENITLFLSCKANVQPTKSDALQIKAATQSFPSVEWLYYHWLSVISDSQSFLQTVCL